MNLIAGKTLWSRGLSVVLAVAGSGMPLYSQEVRVPQKLDFDLSSDESAWLRSRQVIRYGSDPSWPPFSIRTRDGLEGIDHDLAELFEARLGVKFEYVAARSWEETLKKLERGEIDFVTGIANLPERPAPVIYTRSYTSFPVGMIMRKDGPFFTSLEQIERQGLTLAAPVGYAPTVYIEQNFPGIRLLRTGTSVEALRHVAEGTADVTVENLGVAAHLIREAGLLNLMITGSTRHHFDPAFGVNPDLPELQSILNKLLDSVTREEQLGIYKRWILVDLAGMWGWRRVVWTCAIVLAFAALLVGLILASNRRLARELKARREVEDTLRKSEDRFRRLFERMDQAYFLTRPDGKIQFVNETAVEMLGIGSRPVVERLSLVTFLQRPDDLTEIVAAFLTGEVAQERSVNFIRADGSAIRGMCRIRLHAGADAPDDALGIEWLVREVA